MKKFNSLRAATFLLALYGGLCLRAEDYSNGILWINEDYYGQENSTVNFLRPDAENDFWTYRVLRKENPGMELGSCAEFGTIFDNRLYILSKLPGLPGGEAKGGKITIADAATLKILHQQEEINPDIPGTEGRAFVGINPQKGYISTSTGIYIFNPDSYEIEGMVADTGNSGEGNPYKSQCGMMVLSESKVFAAHREKGIMVINPETDKVNKVISLDFVEEGAGVGSITNSKDGMLWISVTKDTSGSGENLPYLVRLNPVTLETLTVSLSDNIYAPANSWYAWTPDAFVASRQQNCLYWKGSNGRWSAATAIFKFDCDTFSQELFVDLEPDGWKLYGAALGVDPVSDDIYMGLFRDYSNTQYTVRRYASSGEIIKDYNLSPHYWFPSMPIFTSENYSGLPLTPLSDNDECGSVYSLQGMCVATGVMEEELSSSGSPDLPPGIYIWKSTHESRKFIINR